MEGFSVKTHVLYGKSEVEVNVPDDSTVIEPQKIEALDDYTSAIQNVLRQPTGSKPLKEMVKKMILSQLSLVISLDQHLIIF